MKVTTTPAAHLAFANLAYCSPSDLSQFAVRGSDLFLTNVADVHTEKFLSERMVVEDVDMEEAPGLTVSKKSELLLVHVKYIT
ncbi:hypothetical protein F2Q68_00025949 [Brassica cretica]|uniref:Vesicle-fusing ATPase n=1 Tax=Brassica cretica TaxID=69181 RepID=A0A8S9IFR5_BRACR|nr:hypothetical protein F2Q68_00025949 [Brassica cretica]